MGETQQSHWAAPSRGWGGGRAPRASNVSMVCAGGGGAGTGGGLRVGGGDTETGAYRPGRGWRGFFLLDRPIWGKRK